MSEDHDHDHDHDKEIGGNTYLKIMVIHRRRWVHSVEGRWYALLKDVGTLC